ncbi:MAG: tetratricopeptide repeat protein [Nitrospiraceae bacterium]
MKKFLAVSVFALCAALVAGTASADKDMGKTAPALKTAVGSKGESHNTEGIEHYNKGHWDVAKKHFMEAAKADPQSAEAHYNLALTLDKSGDHKSATEHFMKAHDLGKGNAEIQNSEILKGHLKAMKH